MASNGMPENPFGDSDIPWAALQEVPGAEEELADNVERLSIGSRRQTPSVLVFERTNEDNSVRDAQMLRTFLSTTLHPETWELFVRDVVTNSPISHQVIRAMISNPHVMQMMMSGSEVPGQQGAAPKRRRARRLMRKPEDERYEDL